MTTSTATMPKRKRKRPTALAIARVIGYDPEAIRLLMQIGYGARGSRAKLVDAFSDDSSYVGTRIITGTRYDVFITIRGISWGRWDEDEYNYTLPFENGEGVLAFMDIITGEQSTEASYADKAASPEIEARPGVFYTASPLRTMPIGTTAHAVWVDEAAPVPDHFEDIRKFITSARFGK